MARVEMPTAQALISLYNLLPPERKEEFVRLLARQSTANLPLRIAREMNAEDQARFLEPIFQHTFSRLMPVLAQAAVRLVRESPESEDAALAQRIAEVVNRQMEEYDRGISQREQVQLKKKRDRQSTPAMIRRNVEICDLRKLDDKKWTQGKLAKHFKKTPSMIRKILKSEAEWRRKAAQLSTN